MKILSLLLALYLSVNPSAFSQSGPVPTINSPGSCSADPSKTLFVLDISSSMLDDNKITKAKTALKVYVGNLPQTDSLGFMTFYGCSDASVKYEVKISEGSHPDVLAASSRAKPVYKTALGLALSKSKIIAENSGDCIHVVVFSDGADTCNGKPLLHASNIAKQCSCVSIVGVGLDKNTVEGISDIAKAGNGEFCNAVGNRSIEDCLIKLGKSVDRNRNNQKSEYEKCLEEQAKNPNRWPPVECERIFES